MKELTDEQLEAASSAWCNPRGFRSIHEGFRAIAPHLQLPWEGPTDDEISRATNEASYATMSFVLRRFVERRNYDRLPKADKRVEIVAQTLRCTGLVDPLEDRYVAVAKNIIEALDKEKP